MGSLAVPVAQFRSFLPNLPLVVALNGPHGLRYPPPHQICSLPEWVCREVGIGGLLPTNQTATVGRFRW